jgi:predicted transposase/invertase (TIGR01784 family)
LSRDEVDDVIIENPITPGEAIDDKEYQLDIYVSLNNNTYINLEMQVLNYNNWPLRSLAYLSRKFDNLHRGEDYSVIKPVYQIGFLDFTLFEDHPEFFARYQMRNARDGYLYTDKFNLLVVELNHTDMASDEDKQYGIDVWARLFKANSWEEIKMITKNNPSLSSTAESIYLYNSDEQVRELCRRREDAIAHEAFQKKKIEELTSENASLTSEVESLSSKNISLVSENESLVSENELLHSAISDRDAKLQKYIELYGDLDQ